MLRSLRTFFPLLWATYSPRRDKFTSLLIHRGRLDLPLTCNNWQMYVSKWTSFHDTFSASYPTSHVFYNLITFSNFYHTILTFFISINEKILLHSRNRFNTVHSATSQLCMWMKNQVFVHDELSGQRRKKKFCKFPLT